MGECGVLRLLFGDPLGPELAAEYLPEDTCLVADGQGFWPR